MYPGSRTDRSAGDLRWKSLVAFDPVLPIGIGFDQARIDCNSFTTDQSLFDAAVQDALERSTEEIALPEATLPILGNKPSYRSVIPAFN